VQRPYGQWEHDLGTVPSSKPTGKVSILEAANTKAVRYEHGFQEIVTERLLRFPEIENYKGKQIDYVITNEIINI